MSVHWTDETRKLLTHCIECGRKGKDCPGWDRPTGGCANGVKVKEQPSE